MLALAGLTMPQGARAAEADQLFADGNRLFRDDLYFAALLRYRQAGEAGMDSPLLHFNTGVAHYKAQQYDRARESLLQASTYAPLQAISLYNLGLAAYADGDDDEALGYFRRARDQRQNPEISELAKRAITSLNRQNIVTEQQLEAPGVTEIERELTRFELRARVGAGLDDNVFRSPAAAYVDLADPGQPLVTPTVQEGVFVPVSLHAKYQVNSLENEGFFGVYQLDGRYYQDKNLSNANEYLHEIGFGSEYARLRENRERRIYSAFKFAQHEDIYYDPDTGLENTIDGASVGDRMSYIRYGPELWMRQKFGRLSIGGRVKGQLWNYKQVEDIPEYDHEYWMVGVNTQYQFTRTSLLRLTGEYFTRRFGDRPSFDLDGNQFVGTRPVRYDYTQYGIEARQRITDAMWFGVVFGITNRVDQYLGYNTYQRDNYGAQIHLSLGNRFEFDATGSYRVYHYDNAFAFNNPAAGSKTQEIATGTLAATYRITDTLTLFGEYLYRDVASNDLRIAYGRSQMLIGVRWAQ